MKSFLEDFMDKLRKENFIVFEDTEIGKVERPLINELILSGLYGHFFVSRKNLFIYEKQKTSFRSFAFKIHFDEKTIQNKATQKNIEDFVNKWMIIGEYDYRKVIKYISVYSRIHYILTIPSFLYLSFICNIEKLEIKDITEIGKEIGTSQCPHCHAIVINTNNSIAECPNGHKFTV